ncbi:hypothetical protein KR018_009944, partial [Drosophila ironensis]
SPSLSTMNSDLYQGHSIFRHQPSYKVFNRSIEQAGDSLYAYLNEVDPEVLRQEINQTSAIFTSFNDNVALLDPRTQEVPASSLCDHSDARSCHVFPNPMRNFSALNTTQQQACLRVLLAMQRGESFDEADFVVWQATEVKRGHERQQLQNQVREYEQAQKEAIYAPMKRLILAYRKWYARRVQRLLKDHPKVQYATFSGLPQIFQSKGLNSNTASIERVELERIVGQVRLWPVPEVEGEALRTLQVRLDRYSGGVTEHVSNLLRDEDKQVQLEIDHIFVLPLDSLLMLLSSGSYVDLPTEMLLSIKDSTSSGHKCVEFQPPFPARHCGWHTNTLLLKEAYETYISQPGAARWLDFGTNGATNELQTPPNSDISSVNLQMDYKPRIIDSQPPEMLNGHCNTALVSWSLKCQAQQFSVFSTLSIPAMRDSEGKEPIGCHLIKLENKPDCGCEIMTKYELLKAWLQMKLLQSELGYCTRVSLRNFEPVLEERLTLISLEQQLQDYHSTNVSQLLSNLYELLKLLLTVPAGDYLLRYSFKYHDKFLLCNASQDTSVHNFDIHKVLAEASPSDQSFLAHTSYLPISTTLCSRMHTNLQLVPCCFPPKQRGRFVQRGLVLSRPEPRTKVPSKRTKNLKNTPSNKRRKCKTAQKNRAKARKAAAKKQELQEEEKLEKFMCL